MTVYEREYRVDSRETDPWYNCRPSGVLGFLQEAAKSSAHASSVRNGVLTDLWSPIGETWISWWMEPTLWLQEMMW